MSNPYGYPEQFMHGQNDLRWAFRKLTPFSKNMKEIGCALTCLSYIISRHDKKDLLPGTFLDWIAQKAKDAKYKDYMTTDGRVYWNAVDRFTGGSLVNCGSVEKKYTLTEVYWGTLRHWVVELKGGLVFNPYGYKVEKLNQPKWYPTGRKQYLKSGEMTDSTLGYELVYKPLTVVLVGGTGSLGTALAKFLIERPEIGTIRIFSRDEFKQSELQKRLTSPKLRYFVGDVRDEKRLQSAFYQAHIVIHAAAMKQVPACEYNPQEAVKTNIKGTENVISACVDQGVERAIFISTDKAVDPVNLYGATKLVAEKVWLNANKINRTKFSLTRWGNVIGSRGSVTSLFKEQAKTGTVTITHRDMTRFWITLDECVKFLWDKLGTMNGGEIFIPECRSSKITDLAKVIAPNAKQVFTGIREGEKLHETLGLGYYSNDKKRLLTFKQLKKLL